MLGLAVESYSEAGTLNAPDEPGELVCLKPFPCMPAGFWPLPGYGTDDEVAAARAKYHQAYFTTIPGVWCTFCVENLTRLLMLAKIMGTISLSHVRGLEMAEA
jgi:acyl-coenzyme A synthetase/AMP-(fatty) acid ligase